MNEPARRWATPMGMVAAAGAALLGAWLAREGIARYQEHRAAKARAAAWGLDAATAERINRVVQREMRPLLAHPRFRSYLDEKVAAAQGTRSPAEMSAYAQGLGRALTARGLPRLSDDDLAAVHALRTKMALASERDCPCYWDMAGCTQADVMDGLARLSEAELTRWARLSTVGGIAELEATAAVVATDGDFQRGMAAVLAGLPAPDGQRLRAILDRPPPVPKRDQCDAIRAIFQAAERLPPPDRARFIRAIANLGAKDDPR